MAADGGKGIGQVNRFEGFAIAENVTGENFKLGGKCYGFNVSIVFDEGDNGGQFIGECEGLELGTIVENFSIYIIERQGIVDFFQIVTISKSSVTDKGDGIGKLDFGQRITVVESMAADGRDGMAVNGVRNFHNGFGAGVAGDGNIAVAVYGICKFFG